MSFLYLLSLNEMPMSMFGVVGGREVRMRWFH